MTVFDYVVCVIFFVSVILGITRGFVCEVLSIAGWVAAFVVAGAYTSYFVQFLPDAVVGETLRFLVTFVLVFLTVLVNTALLTMLLTALIKNIGLGFIDRLFGSLFGFLRALIIVTVIVIIAGLTKIPTQSFLQQAYFSMPLEMVASRVVTWLPEDLAKHINFDRKESY